ncbi:protein O-mannosyl-transferase family [Armatimonas sp.]|uniref:protein O-mannosyl-transferase family n=1 Tax=Armatimonas sp. TaxID=1872638 RepID=UPI0037510EAF
MSSLSDRKIAWLLFAVAALLYALTMCRTIYTGDDGDFELAMATLGVCHPTGYPLFTLLGRAFLLGLEPIIDEPAMRVNLMTALFGAAAVAIFYRFLAALISSRLVAASAALLLAFAPTLWQQSLSCEVYTLTALFLCTVLWLSVRLERGERVLAPLVLVYGLALTNNLTMALFLPGFLMFAWHKVGFKKLFAYLPLFLLPLLLYAYIPLAAKFSHSPVLWGSPKTPELFYKHLSGDLYRQLMFSQPLSVVGENTIRYVKALVAEFGPWTLWLAPAGIVSLWKTQRSLLLLSVWIALGSLIYVVNYHILDIYVYYLPSFMIITVWIAAGALSLAQRMALKPSITALAAIGLPLIALGTHWKDADKSGNFIEADFSENILRSAPHNALIVTDSNVIFTLWYQKWVKHQRPDVVVAEWNTLSSALLYDAWYYRHLLAQYPALDSAIAGASLSTTQFADGSFQRAFFRQALTEGRPVLLVRDTRFARRKVLNTSLAEVATEFELAPWGVTERLYLPGTRPDSEALLAANLPLWARFTTRGLLTGWGERDPLQRHIFVRYAEAFQALDALAKETGHPEALAVIEKRMASQ